MDPRKGVADRPLGAHIGGANYAWGDDQLVRLFPRSTNALFVEWFHSVALALLEAGLPVPAVGNIIDLPQGTGIIYERLAGETIGEHMISQAITSPNILSRMAVVFAQTHLRLHDVRRVPAVPVGPRMFAPMIEYQKALSTGQQEKLLARLTRLSLGPFVGDCGPCLCHGDFHPLNVILSPRGPIVIDWANVHLGDPLEDVARAMLILDGVPIEQPDLPVGIALFAKAYLDEYVALFCDKYQVQEADVRARIDAWRPVVLAIRLSDNRPNHEPWLMAQIEQAL